jgi:serine/threonine-protein kinase
VKLLDFGLAKHFVALDDIGPSDDLTATGTVTGTIHYMAPERLDVDATVDYRCDLFSLGVIMYQMATGARPFEIEPRQALLTAIREQPHVPVRRLAEDHPTQLAHVIDTLLAKHPDDRYQTARAVRAELALLRPDSLLPETDQDSRRKVLGSVAVLPFQAIGAVDDATLAFRSGLAEDISSRLTRLAGLRVAPRTSTRLLAGRTVREIGASLGVESVLEGTVQHTADRIRVTANLVDAADERSVLPAIRVDRRFTDLFDAQDEVAREVCDGLGAWLSRRSRREEVRDPEAAHAFTRALHHWRSCFAGGWRPALEHLQYALTRDPRFAEARVALANGYNFLGFYCLLKPNPAFSMAKREAELALAVDPNLAAAHVELALATLGGDWDWEGAEREFRRALALDASNPLAHVYYSWLLALLGREDAALAEAQRGHALAPASRLVTCARAQTLYLTARYGEVIDTCTECLRTDASYVFAVHLRGLARLALAQQDLAVADLEQAATLTHRVPFYLGLLGRCYGRFGMLDEARALLSELQALGRSTYVPPQCYVYIHAGLGEPSAALTYQEQAYVDGASPFNYLNPHIRELYALDPYHKSRLNQMRLVI